MRFGIVIAKSRQPSNLRLTTQQYVHLVTRGNFRSHDKNSGHIIRSAMSKHLMLHANFMTVCFTEPELLGMEVLRFRNRDFRPFWLLWPLPWPDDLHVYPVETYQMCENELCTSRLSKGSILQTDTHTYICMPRKLFITPLPWRSIKKCKFLDHYKILWHHCITSQIAACQAITQCTVFWKLWHNKRTITTHCCNA